MKLSLRLLLIAVILLPFNGWALMADEPLKKATINGLELAYRDLGNPQGEPVLLIMGLGASHVFWGDEIVAALSKQGYRVILHDNRDVGASQTLEDLGEPVLWWQLFKSKLGFSVDAPYSLYDMADDSVALLDYLQIERANIVGASMGGMIAQIIAGNYPEHTHTLTSIMSTTGAEHLPEASGDSKKRLTDFISGDVDVEKYNAIGLYPQGVPRQIMAIYQAGDRSEEVKQIKVPTLVLHGADDTLLSPKHGEHTAELIEGSVYVVFDGMAHNLPEAVVPQLVDKMVDHFSR